MVCMVGRSHGSQSFLSSFGVSSGIMIDDTLLLVKLAQMGAAFRLVKVTTVRLAENLRVSQQSVSRRLAALEMQDIIEKKPALHGLNVRLTQKGIAILHDLHSSLLDVFGQKLEVEGKVVEGIGRRLPYPPMLQLAEVGVGDPVFRGRLDVAEGEALRVPKMRDVFRKGLRGWTEIRFFSRHRSPTGKWNRKSTNILRLLSGKSDCNKR